LDVVVEPLGSALISSSRHRSTSSIPFEALRSVLLGEAMTDALARTLEHAAGRPHYWMDAEHREHSRA
jgi:hypothetical protein